MSDDGTFYSGNMCSELYPCSHSHNSSLMLLPASRLLLELFVWNIWRIGIDSVPGFARIRAERLLRSHLGVRIITINSTSLLSSNIRSFPRHPLSDTVLPGAPECYSSFNIWTNNERTVNIFPLFFEYISFLLIYNALIPGWYNF